MFLIKFQLNPTYGYLKNFKMAVGYWNGTILAILNLYVTTMPPIKFRVNPTFGLKGDASEEFQDGRHLGYRNGTILAILNLYVTLMLPIKFRLNLSYSLGGDVVWRTSSSWITELNDFSNSESLCGSWITERNDFCNSESLCCSDTSHQVSAQSGLWFGWRCRLKNFKMATIFDIGTEWF